MRGIDIGTTKVLAAVPRGCPRERNAFLDLKKSAATRGVLQRLGICYEEHPGRIHVVGDDAFLLAQVFDKDTRRPMRDGMLDPREESALAVIEALVRRVLGTAPEPLTPCGYTVPAPPVDRDADVLYQQSAFERILRDLGYAPVPVREGLAVVLSELESSDFTGIGVSVGGGMVNVCVAYKGVEAVGFSTTRGGDWIDRRVAQALGYLPPEITAVKEQGVNLRSPGGRVEEAVAIYTRHLIRYTAEKIAEAFHALDAVPAFGGALPVAVAGGVSQMPGFIDVLREDLARVTLPVEAGEIRLAGDPVAAPALGCRRVTAEIIL